MFDLEKLKKVSDEVFICKEEVIQIGKEHVDFVKNQALNNARGRARICMHSSSEDPLHEMLIAVRQDSYICPHRHHNKIESLHVVLGSVTVVIFNEDGSIMKTVYLNDSETFYYRLNKALYHTLIIHSPVLVQHEVTQGPFRLSDSDFAPFAPKENEEGCFKYIEELTQSIFTMSTMRFKI